MRMTGENNICLCQFVNFFSLFFAAALEYFKCHPQDPINHKEFEETCGVGARVPLTHLK